MSKSFNKSLYFLLTTIIVSSSFAISLGDIFDQQILLQSNTSTQITKLVSKNSKFISYQTNSNHGTINFLVNVSNNKVYSISWNEKQNIILRDILGEYYLQFQQSAKKPQSHMPLRAITVDNGDLYVTQFGSMMIGMHGTAYVRSIAP